MHMETKIPRLSAVLGALLRADFTTQWRNRRSVILVLLVPVIILISWKNVVAKFGPTFVLGSCITVGLTAMGLMGYSNSVARDRDKGIFQRLRVAPVPSWSIMVSRLIVQSFMILLVNAVVFIAGSTLDGIRLTGTGYVLSFLAALVGGSVYLGLGQAIVGRIENAETVYSTTRLVYFVFILVGMFGEVGILGKDLGELVKWSPYGTVKRILAASMRPETWNIQASLALAVTLAYTLLFTSFGVRWFKWTSR
jgi:ABC-2 type transport system permease protein